jgi:hypothetical protein
MLKDYIQDKFKNSSELFSPFIKDIVQLKLKDEQYQKQIDSIIQSDLKEIVLKNLSNKTEQQVENAIKEHIFSKTTQFDKMMISSINSEVRQEINKIKEATNKEINKNIQYIETEIKSWLPELKKMSIEYLKNNIKEVVQNERNKESESKISS